MSDGGETFDGPVRPGTSPDDARSSATHLSWVTWVVLVPTAALLVGGCAIHYFDRDTGVEHVWGVGHMAMRVTAPTEGRCGIVRGLSSLGLVLGVSREEQYLSLGWQSRHQVDVLASDSAFRLEWPRSSLWSLRVGASPPFARVENENESDPACRP